MSDEIIQGLRSRLTQNLADVKYDGPQQLITGDLVTLLMDLLMGVLDGCFQSSRSLSNVRETKSLNFFQRGKLRRELISEVYEGSRRAYRLQQGDKVLEALIKTVEEAPKEESDVLIDYVEREAREWTPTDYGSI